ncbi:MAG: NAD(P)H-dependent oxidoreductase [Pseudomonadota bacterium]
MAQTIAILQGHPDPAGGHLCNGLADAYEAGAAEAGKTVKRIDIAGLDFPLLRSKADYDAGDMPEVLRPAQDAIGAADHIVLIYPLWLGTMPAVTKGFLEQTLRPDFAVDKTGGRWPKGALRGKSARIVVTMSMPKLAYRLFYGAHSLKSLERSILNLCGIRPIRESLFGLVDGADEKTRKKWMEQMRLFGAQGL